MSTGKPSTASSKATAAIKPYSARRNSGSPLLGKVPAHWEVRRLKACAKDVIDITKQCDPAALYIALEHVESWTGKTGCVDLDTAFESQVKRFRANDVLFGKLRPYLAKTTRPDRDGVCVGEFLVLRSRNEDLLPGYLELWLRSRSVIDAIDASTFGAKMPRADWQFIGNLSFPLPPISEQVAIVRYLENVSERADRYIRAMERLISLLSEEKQVTVNRVVTRGLDPNTPRRPTGIDWMPEMPAHWETAALKHRYSQCLGKMLDSKRITGSHLLPYLRNVDVQWDRINVNNLPEMDIAPSEYDRYTVREGDLLVCEGGEVGRCALWSGQLTVCGFQKALHRIRPRTEQDVPRFMYYVLLAAGNANAFSEGRVSTIEHLTGDRLRAHRFPFPPLAEQNAIAEHLDRKTAAIETVIESAHRQIDLVHEYRKRLTSDVVNGKLDVREASAVTRPDSDHWEEAGRTPRHRRSGRTST